MSTTPHMDVAVPNNVAMTNPADRALRDALQIRHVRELWIFLGCVVGFLSIVNFTARLFNVVYRSTLSKDTSWSENKDVENGRSSKTVQYSIRRLPSALATGFRILFFRWSVPIGPGSILFISELTFILVYIAAMLIWLLVDTHDLETMFYQDRAAHLASSQLPLIVALAGKNNMLSFLTGIGHEKLNVLHRAAARTNLVLLWLHAITRSVSGLPQQFDFTHNWMRSGALGLAAFSLATLLSLGPIRQVAFEFFLVTHIILVLIFLVSGFFHAHHQTYGAYIWPALLLWGLDRSLRATRLFFNNRVWTKKDSGHSVAKMELLSDDTVRLTLRRRFSWIPGQHAYIILPTISNLPTEAHPFTIASIPESVDGAKDKDVVFLIRGRGGFTQRLRDHATRNGVCTVPAYLDGPYGCPPDLRSFSTCILVAGGSGISYTLPLLLNLIRLGGNSAVRRVVFVWAVRDGDHLAWISKTLTEALTSVPSSLIIEPRIYVTSSKYPTPDPETQVDRTSSSSSSNLEKDSSSDLGLPEYSSLKLIQGRPNIRRLLHDEILESGGPVSVDVAGPTNLAEAIRHALCSDVIGPLAVLKGLPSVTLHVETFGMSK